ncbi:MAG TPA: tetratricopeptide repeat protein [Gemmatimonadaceae bacterium]|nr:tetratricopeptide repeat protein [Gemmatimonadaceae bacterium]
MASSARIDELRKKFDENPRRYFAPLANEFRKMGDLEQAVFICQEYLPQQPGHMSGHIVYGQALFELGRDEEAKAVFETALSLDPENLIALRHLGDIARQAGDLDVARFWYLRVLESDPRNDEISQLLMSLDSAPSGSARTQPRHSPAVAPEVVSAEPPAAPPAEPPAEPPHEAAPLVAEAPVEIHEPPVAEAATPSRVEPSEPESYEPFEGFDRMLDFDQVVPTSVEEQEAPAAEQEVSILDEPGAAEATAAEVPSTPVATTGEEQLLDLDDFSIGGETVAPPAQPEPVAAAPAPTSDGSTELGAGDYATDETEEWEVAADSAMESAAISAESPTSNETVDEGVFFGVNESTTFEPTLTDSVSLDEASNTEAEPEPDIELATDIELGLPSDEPESAPELETEPQLVESAGQESFAAADMLVDVGADVPTDSSEEVFVTETMAHLYVEQGHLASALEVYEKLAAQHPDDEVLEARVREIKERIYGRPREMPREAERGAEAAPRHAAPSPTIRDFLRGVISGRSSEAANGSQPESSRGTPPRASGTSETVTGSIDALFSNAAPSEEDNSAANALAHAFGEWPEPTPIRGVPAHEASSELSLDHVFKANAPVPRRDDADAFSFDQFFSEESGETPESSGGEQGGAGAPGGDDIAQFNAWLNGLKKT